jgi:DNA-binding NtrC family response regulator
MGMARILLVDDNRDELESVADWLRMRRHHVQMAHGFANAVAALATGGAPDVVISDYDMPPYKGTDLLAIVAARYPGAFRVLYTGSLTEQLPEDTHFAQFIVEKSGDLEHVHDLIRRLMLRRRA